MTSKDVGIRIRVEKDLRKAFQSACAIEGRQASDVIRDFMRTYAEQHDVRQAKLFPEVGDEIGGHK